MTPQPSTATRSAPMLGSIGATRLRPGDVVSLADDLNRGAWAAAKAFDQFVQKEPVNGSTPKYGTSVKVLYDDSSVYVGITAFDDHPEEIRAPLVRRDGVNRTQDSVEVYIDAIGKKQSAQFFSANASGSIADGIYTASDDNEDLSPDFDFDANSVRTDKGYVTIFRIPFSSLRYSSEAGVKWRIQVVRRVPRDEFYTWASVAIPVDAQSFIANSQLLNDFQPPIEKRFLSVRPSITAKRITANSEAGQSASNAVDTSLDVKWRAFPELVVDGTWKPDFSQVELDVPQLSGNTSFALYLPEKRPFFYESSDLLLSPTDAIYTRSYTAPQWGARATWRGATLAGSGFAIKDNGGGTTFLPNAYGTDYAAQPASTSGALRLHVDLNESGRMQIGGTAATKNYDNGAGANTVVGPDFEWLPDEAWRIRAQLLHSSTTAQPDSNGSLSAGPATSGNSIVIKGIRQTDMTDFEFTLGSIDQGFRNDSGFVNQNDVRKADLHQAYVFRNLGPLHEFWLNLAETKVVEATDGRVVQESITPGFWLSSARNLQWWVDYRGISWVRANRDAALLRENYWRSELSLTPSSYISLVDLTANIGRMTDYTAGMVRPGGQVSLLLRTRPTSLLEFEPSSWIAWLRYPQGLAYRETASQLLSVLHLDARQSIRLIVQRTTYDRRPELNIAATRDSGCNTSLTYSWRRPLGTVLYVGMTRAHSGVGMANLAKDGEYFLKLQTDFDDLSSWF